MADYSAQVPLPLHLSCALNSCSKRGTLSCTGCFLVRYCSKECQSEQWRQHRRDCRNPMNSHTWKPAWETEQRPPAFVNEDNMDTSWEAQQRYGWGMALWGNMPAIDILGVEKMTQSEHATLAQRDLKLAFIASGDLRNVIKTVNLLPADYTGKLDILINEYNPSMVPRNFLILSLLGFLDDHDEAAEYALHLWYSVFLPPEYFTRALPSLRSVLQQPPTRGSMIPLTESSSLIATFSDNTQLDIRANIAGPVLNTSKAQEALNVVMNSQNRLDYRERYYVGLRPAHRVAFDRWRRTGVLLPFSEPVSHPAIPNPTLFSEDKLFLNDSASPLFGWSVNDILPSATTHGTTEKDIMGCLFYHVKDQLISFAKRLRLFRITIRMYDEDAFNLASTLPPELKSFDRIEVSNMVDEQYLGLNKVLGPWGRCLSPESKDSCLIGLSINWPKSTPGSTVNESELASKEAMDRLRTNPLPDTIQALRLSPAELFGGRSQTMSSFQVLMLSSLDVFYENSMAFKSYLMMKKAAEAATQGGLKMRTKNKIVPHRVGAELGSSWNSLPDASTDEKWYKLARLGRINSTERYVEWIRA